MELYIDTKSTKKMILDVLIRDYPLTVTNIHKEITKRYKFKVGYFTVYDAVRSLIKQNILIKKERKYSLAPEWIQEIEGVANKIITNYPLYEEKELAKNVEHKENVRMLTFDSLSNFYSFITGFRENFIAKSKKGEDNIIGFVGDHVWGPLLYMKQRSETIKKIKEKGINYYIIIRGSEPLDEFASNFYKRLGINTVKIGVKEPTRTMITLYNDVLLYIIHPSEMIKAIDDLFDSVRDIKNANVITLFDKYFNKKMKFYAIIIKNIHFVKERKSYILSQFN